MRVLYGQNTDDKALVLQRCVETDGVGPLVRKTDTDSHPE